VPLGGQSMTREIAFAAVRLGMEDKKTSGLLFYGGEPLIERQLIYDIVEYTKKLKQETGHTFFYKMTTNGILLDEDFLEFSRDINMSIGFSHDGPAQDDCRLFSNGDKTAEILEEKISLLLKYHPHAVAMSVVDPSTVHKASEIVKFLSDKGFRYISLNLNYDDAAKWTIEHFKILEQEYKKMAKLYGEWTTAEKKFYLSPFDVKIISYLKGEKYHEDRRRMNREQPSIAPDGKIYPGSRYIDQPAFSIGDVFSGIDDNKREDIEKRGDIPPAACAECALITRCNYVYGSLFADKEGAIIAKISPVQCAHERLLTPVADRVAEKLYKKRNALFIHKHYNELYSVISLAEDKS